MNRRGFLSTLIGGVAATTAIRTFPFRVFSFPEKIEIAKPLQVRFIRMFDPIQHKMISRWDAVFGFGQFNMPKYIECGVIGKSIKEVAEMLNIEAPEGWLPNKAPETMLFSFDPETKDRIVFDAAAFRAI